MYSIFLDDRRLEKLDIEVSSNCNVRMSKGLMAMEVPSRVDPNFTVEDVYNCLVEFAKISKKQLEDHLSKRNQK